MCEPNHSIIQYPDQKDDGTPSMPLLQPSIGKKILEWGKKVLGWLHFSKLGSGHSEAIRGMGGSFSSLIPEETRYETRWWDRTTVLDGPFRGGEDFDRDLAWQAAHGYAKVVSIGSLGAVRNFLEVSMRKSERPYMYVRQFLDGFLTLKGRDYASRKLKSALNMKMTYLLENVLGYQCSKDAVEVAIKVMLGLTRKRGLLNAAWADDGQLWTPGQSQGMGGQPSLIGVI